MTPIQVITKYKLEHYFKIIWNSPTADLPYHNTEHLFGVMMSVYDACCFYFFDTTETRVMLIAALFHDYLHTGGGMGYDSINIRLAIQGINEHILEEDRKYLPDIESYIQATEFPHSHIDDTEDNLPLHIMRDADLSYGLSERWISSIIFGIGKEFMKDSDSMLKEQIVFLENLKFMTDWARKKFADKKSERLEEVKQMVKTLY